MNGSNKVKNALATKLGLGAMAAMVALVVGTHAKAQVMSADIVDGQVKTVDIASNAVTTAKIANGAVTSGKLQNSAVSNGKLGANAVTGAKVLDNSLTGADIDEQTLSGVDADALGGATRYGLLWLDSYSTSEVLTLPACSHGLEYMSMVVSNGPTGHVLLNASFTAGTGTNFSAPFGVAARLERTTPTAIVGDWQESQFGSGGSGRTNIAVTQTFPLDEGQNTFVLRVCDASDIAGGQTIRGQLSWILTEN